MATVYRKTAKGFSEIETRAHRLAPRTRSTLILVDGRRSGDALLPLVGPEAPQMLAALLELGFIEEVAPAPAPAQAPPAATAATPPAHGAAFERLRREAVRTLTDLIGPVAEPLAVRMERARTAEELRPLLALAQQSIANTRGRQAAADYAARYGG
jgi:hypothetical protein